MFILQEEKCLNVTDVINFSGTEKFGRCYCYNLSGHLAHWVSVSWLIQMVSLKFFKTIFPPCFWKASTTPVRFCINIHYRDEDVSKLSSSLLLGTYCWSISLMMYRIILEVIHSRNLILLSYDCCKIIKIHQSRLCSGLFLSRVIQKENQENKTKVMTIFISKLGTAAPRSVTGKTVLMILH